LNEAIVSNLGLIMKIITSPPESSVKSLLSEVQLPISDITAEKLQRFFGYESADEIIGIVGIEVFGAVALLRSLVVDPRHRSEGIGSALVELTENFALEEGVKTLYLLTTTAELFFTQRGYIRVPREDAPSEIQITSEFSGICPVSSAFMIKKIG
jgi:amino-acid N-acetyltransferase